MFRSIGYHPIPTDPFNFLRNRNVRNTEKITYNCGGYALGTFSWYCPHRREDDFTVPVVNTLILHRVMNPTVPSSFH